MAASAHDSAPDAPSASPLTTLFNMWAIVFQHKSLVVLGMVVALVLGGLAYFQSTPIYQSTSQVLVVNKRPHMVVNKEGDSRSSVNSFVEDYLPTHVTLIQSTEVLRRAAKNIDPATLNVAPVDGEMAKFLKGGLTVGREKERDGSTGPTNILKISYRSGSPTDCPRLVNAIIDGYRDFLTETYGSLNDETLQLITKAQTMLERDLKEKQSRYQEIWKRNPLALKNRDSAQVYLERIKGLEQKRATLNIRQKELETQQKVISDSLAAGEKRSVILTMLKEINDSSRTSHESMLMSLEANVLGLMAKEAQLRINLGDKHPEVLAAQKQVQFLQDQLLRYGKPITSDKDADPLDLMVQAMKVEHKKNAMMLQALEPELQDQTKDAQSLAHFLIEEEEARNDVNRVRMLYEGVVDQLRRTTVAREAGGFDARTITPAAAGTKVAPSLTFFGALALVAGVGLGIGLAYLADYTDKSFRSPQEIQQRLGLSVIGHIPFIPEDTQGDPALHERVAPALVAFHAPRSPEAEAFRGVRTALYFSTQGKGHQVIQVTSPGMGDGKSTLMANLAISIAQTGRRTVLIDADFRRPKVHKLFPDAKREVGMASVISGEATLEQATQATAVPNLSLMPCGPRPANPAELLTSPRFQELLEDMRKRYDFILIDTPPVLLVSDPCVVAPRVDGVILVLRLNKNNRPAAERATEVLSGLGANVLGIMVNDSERNPRAGKYGYGYGYGYGYRYNYRYSYEYGYGYQPAYADSEDDDTPPAEARAASAARRGKAEGTLALPQSDEPPPSNGFHININGDAPLPPKG